MPKRFGEESKPEPTPAPKSMFDPMKQNKPKSEFGNKVFDSTETRVSEQEAMVLMLGTDAEMSAALGISGVLAAAYNAVLERPTESNIAAYKAALAKATENPIVLGVTIAALAAYMKRLG